MSKVALIEIANTDNINIIWEGNYWLTLPDGSQVSPVYAGWTGENYMIRGIDLDEPIPTYLQYVTVGEDRGTGYTQDDNLIISGGETPANVAVLKVYGIGSNGLVSTVIISNTGYYTSNPPEDNMPTGGTGTGVHVDISMAQFSIASQTYEYDTNLDVVVETNTYETPVIDNTSSIEAQRQEEMDQDPNNISLKDKLKNATSAQITNWINNNVTDLASARVVLAAIVKFLANNIDRLGNRQFGKKLK